jgi:hypothetical protein
MGIRRHGAKRKFFTSETQSTPIAESDNYAKTFSILFLICYALCTTYLSVGKIFEPYETHNFH